MTKAHTAFLALPGVYRIRKGNLYTYESTRLLSKSEYQDTPPQMMKVFANALMPLSTYI